MQEFEFEIDKPNGGTDGIFHDYFRLLYTSILKEKNSSLNFLQRFDKDLRNKNLEDSINEGARQFEYIIKTHGVRIKYNQYNDEIVVKGSNFTEAYNKSREFARGITKKLQSYGLRTAFQGSFSHYGNLDQIK